MQNSTDIRKLTEEARKILAQFISAESELVLNFDLAAERAWQLGRRLNPLKKRIGHGNWEKWRQDAFPTLSDRDAQRCQALDRMNPKAQRFSDLSIESLRKYRFGYVPAKERPKLQGDKKFARPSSHANVVGECNKLAHRVDTGLYKPNLAELVHDFEPFYQWLTRARERISLGKAA